MEAKIMSEDEDDLQALNHQMAMAATRKELKALNGNSGSNMLLWLIPILAISIPLFIFGATAAWSFVKFMNSPIINGQVPMWIILAIVFVFVLYIRKR
jgi:hypothetical protein